MAIKYRVEVEMRDGRRELFGEYDSHTEALDVVMDHALEFKGLARLREVTVADYSHRNGETDEPTVKGTYWVDGGTWFWTHKWDDGWDANSPYLPHGKPIYGPIPEPKR